MGESSPGGGSYNSRNGRETGAHGRGQRFAGTRDGLDLSGRLELGEALTPTHLIRRRAEHLRHGPIGGRFHS